MHIEKRAGIRLFQLISPSLPTGAFTYSQGLEWAVDAGWVGTPRELEDWLAALCTSSLERLEIPLLKRLYTAAAELRFDDFLAWRDYLLACRETSELRMEEVNRGRAMARLLNDLEPELSSRWLDVIRDSQLAGFAFAAASWQLGLEPTAIGYGWSWLENLVMAAVKLIPLGHTPGQQVLRNLVVVLEESVVRGLSLEDEDIGGSCPALAIGSSLHETQYTRLFRS